MDLMDILEEFSHCNKCGLCLASCPVCRELMLEKYSPRGKIQLARFHHQHKLGMTEHYRDIFAECLLCGACETNCRSRVKLTDVFKRMREKASFGAGPHPKTEKVVRSLEQYHNIAGEDNADRLEWSDSGEGLPARMSQTDRAAVVYFVGCVASFYPTVQQIPREFTRILESSGVDFAVLGGDEWCCGFPLIAAGLPEKAHDMMRHNLEKIEALGANTVVFSCPSCYRTWRELYPADLELLHSTQFLLKLIHDSKLRLKPMLTTATYHDPCDLGRHAGVYEAPRDILKAVPGLTLVELPHNREQSICCGGGGNLEMVDPKLSARIAARKIEEIRSTGAEKLVTSCQQCVRTIMGGVRKLGLPLEVFDIILFISQAMEHDDRSGARRRAGN